MAETLSGFGDQRSRAEEDEHCLAYVVDHCSVCWWRTIDGPICDATSGILQEALHWVSGGHMFSITETEYVATGDNSCTFVVNKRAAES